MREPRAGDHVASASDPKKDSGYVTHVIDPNGEPRHYGVYWVSLDKSHNHRADDLVVL